MMSYEPAGVIPACLLPFQSDLSIDEAAYREHLRDVASVDGIGAITVNGHASEVHALTADEQRRVLQITREELEPRNCPFIAGIYTGSSLEAARLARMAAEEGASALLVFPPESTSLGGQQRPEIAHAHFQWITEATDLPLILFQYPISSGLGYPLETLLSLAERFPGIRAIKDWCNDPALHERHIRELHGLSRPLKVLTTHSAWLLPSLVLGCDGLLSGAGSVIAELQVALFQAVQRNDLATARALNDRIFPTVRAFYRAPLLDMHNRMKEALVHLGKLDAAYVRPPLVKLPPAEIEEIGRLLHKAALADAQPRS